MRLLVRAPQHDGSARQEAPVRVRGVGGGGGGVGVAESAVVAVSEGDGVVRAYRSDQLVVQRCVQCCGQRWQQQDGDKARGDVLPGFASGQATEEFRYSDRAPRQPSPVAVGLPGRLCGQSEFGRPAADGQPDDAVHARHADDPSEHDPSGQSVEAKRTERATAPQLGLAEESDALCD